MDQRSAALGLLRHARKVGHLSADWATADAGYGEAPTNAPGDTPLLQLAQVSAMR